MFRKKPALPPHVSELGLEGAYLEPTAEGGVIVCACQGLFLFSDSELLESVPWVGIDHLSFGGKRELTITFSRVDVAPAVVRLESPDPRKFMDAARGYLEDSVVLVRQRKTDSGTLLRGTVRRDSDGSLLLLVSAPNGGAVLDEEVDAFEADLRELTNS